MFSFQKRHLHRQRVGARPHLPVVQGRHPGPVRQRNPAPGGNRGGQRRSGGGPGG